MKDITSYFSPIELDLIEKEATLGQSIHFHTEGGFPELKSGSIALFYVPEFRNGIQSEQGLQDDRFRNHFYSFFKGANWKSNILDLGNLLPGSQVEDTYFAVRQITAELVKNKIIPIIVGGSQDLTYAIYQGYEELEQMINVMAIDNQLDLGDPENAVEYNAFVSKLLMHRPCFLFNYAVLGCQTPLIHQEEMELFDKLYFDTVRLGEFTADNRIAEPMLRNADVLSIDLQSIRASEFSGKHYQQPNGFSNQEMCQLARYAGISDKLTSFGIFNLFPSQLSESNHALVAQLIWYFIDGVFNRFGDFPIGSKKEYIKFTVFLDEINHELVFFKSNKSDRWWMEVPYPSKKGVKFDRHHLVPCNKLEYDNALKGEIPDLWWRTFQKLG